MRLISVSNCVSGMILAKPIYTENGTTLVGKGVILTQRMIENLKARNVTALYIKHQATEDIVIEDNIPPTLRAEAIDTIRTTFKSLQIGDHKVKKAIDIDVVKFQKVFKNLLKELKNNKNVINLMTNIYAHDNYIFSHSLNVALYALAIAIKQNYDDNKLNDLILGGILHDIGKVIIPLEILNKKGKLTKEEFDIVKMHSEYGFELLRNQYGLSLLSSHCAFQHHEKIDGTGYPRGLKGDEIHPYAKMIAISDVFDALTTHRSYRKAMLPHEAMEILFTSAGTHLDIKFVEIFRNVVASYPVGVTVKLSTGYTGVVVSCSFDMPGRPIVRLIKDPYGNDLKTFSEIDLSKNLSMMIVECDATM